MKMKRTETIQVNDIFCRACRAKLARVVDYRHVHLTGWDARSMIDLEGGTVTVKCRCGVGRVIRKKSDYDERQLGDKGVWFEEVDESGVGEQQVDSQGDGDA